MRLLDSIEAVHRFAPVATLYKNIRMLHTAYLGAGAEFLYLHTGRLFKKLTVAGVANYSKK